MRPIVQTALTEQAFDPAAALEDFHAVRGAAGACASFTGFARPTGADGAAIATLTLDIHPRLTTRSLREIGTAVAARFALGALHILHRHGRIAPGEAIVFVAAAAPHRRSAFDAVDCAMDMLKTDAVFWKHEEGAGGDTWIEPRDTDHADRARWEHADG